MPAAALGLVAAAALLHASWNAMAKGTSDPLSFLYWAMLGSALLFAGPAVLVYDGAIDATGLGALGASSAIHAMYITALAAAYRAGDFSQVYPLARGGGVAGVAIASPLVLGESFTWLGGIGVGAVIAGAVLLGWRRGQGAAVGWAVVTAVLIAGYSMVDDIGVDHIHPLVYIAALGAGTVLCLTPGVWRKRRALIAELRGNPRQIAAAAALSMSAYLMVLFAFRLSQATYVVAAREISIALSVIAGVVIFGETRGRRRFGAALVILAGVVAIAAS